MNEQSIKICHLELDDEEISFEKLLQKTASPKTVKETKAKSVTTDREFHTEINFDQEISMSKIKMENKLLNQELERLRNKYERQLPIKQKKIKQLLTKCKQLEKQAKSESQNSNILKNNIEISQMKFSKMEKDLSNKYKGLEQRLSKKIQKLSTQLNNKQNSLKQVKKENKNKIKNTEEEIGKIQKQLSVKEKQILKYEQILKERNTYYDNQLDKKTNQIKKLKEELNEKEEEILSLKQSVADGKIEVLNEIQNLSAEQENISKQINQKDEKIREYNVELERILDFVGRNFKNQTKIDNSMELGAKQKGNAVMLMLQKVWQERIKNQNQFMLGVENYNHKYRREVDDLQTKLTLLMEENTYLKKQIQHNLQEYSFSLSRSRKEMIDHSRQLNRREKSVDKKFRTLQESSQAMVNEKSKIIQEVKQARKILQNTRLSGSPKRERRGRSMPNVHREPISWRKPSSIYLQKNYS